MASRLVPDGNFFKTKQNDWRKLAANSKWCLLLASGAGSASLLMLAIAACNPASLMVMPASRNPTFVNSLGS
eukprot:4351669-Ditylum_brightwellii.AAC.1